MVHRSLFGHAPRKIVSCGTATLFFDHASVFICACVFVGACECAFVRVRACLSLSLITFILLMSSSGWMVLRATVGWNQGSGSGSRSGTKIQKSASLVETSWNRCIQFTDINLFPRRSGASVAQRAVQCKQWMSGASEWASGQENGLVIYAPFKWYSYVPDVRAFICVQMRLILCVRACVYIYVCVCVFLLLPLVIQLPQYR